MNITLKKAIVALSLLAFVSVGVAPALVAASQYNTAQTSPKAKENDKDDEDKKNRKKKKKKKKSCCSKESKGSCTQQKAA